MEKDYDKYLESIRIENIDYSLLTDNCLPELWQNLEVPNGKFYSTEGNYNYEDITTRCLSQPLITPDRGSIMEPIVIPLNIKLPPMERMFDKPLKETINAFDYHEAYVFGWWKFSQLVKLHPLIERHQYASMLIDTSDEAENGVKVVGLTYFSKDENFVTDDAYSLKLALYRDACHQYFVNLKKDFWKIEIRKSIHSKLSHTNISLPRYLFKDNKLLQDGIMFKVKNDKVMLWDDNETINIYHLESQNHFRFNFDDLPDVLNDKEIKKLMNYKLDDIQDELEHATREGRSKVNEYLDVNCALAKGIIEIDSKMQELITMAIKLLAAYCTPTLKKGIKKISKKAPRSMNKHKHTKRPTKWVWGTNHVTYIYPPQVKKKGVSEFYRRPTMAKYYIVNLDKYKDRPIYEECNTNPRYRHSVILSRAGSWQGGMDKMFFAGAESKNYSYKAITWLKQMSKLTGNNIQHAENGKEFRIELGHDKYYLADGYCSKSNTVYEFNGDYWHGNPDVYDADAINKTTKTTFGELHKQTLEKESTLKKMGFNVVSVWEKEWTEPNLI